MRKSGRLSRADVLRLSSWEMAKFAPFFVIGYFIFSIFIEIFTFTKISKYDANDSGSFDETEIAVLEADKSLLGKVDVNKNGKIDGLQVLPFDKDASGSFSDRELKALQATKEIFQQFDENKNGKMDAKEVRHAEEYLQEINNANGYLSLHWKIDGAVLLAYILILFGISCKYLYSYQTREDKRYFLEKFPKFIGLREISLFVIASGFAAAIMLAIRGQTTLFILVLSTTFLFIFAFLHGLKGPKEQSGREPRQKPNKDDDADEIRTLKWHFPSIPGDKYSGKEMGVSYRVNATRYEAFQRRNKHNFQDNANSAPPIQNWPSKYIECQSQETKELAVVMYSLVKKYGLSEYLQVQLILSAVHSMTYEKDSVSVPDMVIHKTDKVKAVKCPAKDKLTALAYLYLKVSINSSVRDGQDGFSEGERDEVKKFLSDWFDEWNRENALEFSFSDVDSFVDEVTEYVRAENSGNNPGDAEERFYKPVIEAFTPDQHRRILDEMDHVMSVENLDEEDMRRAFQEEYFDYVEKRFDDHSASEGEYVNVELDEYPRYPTETLYEQRGNSDDAAMLLVALLRECHFEVKLLDCVSDVVDLKTGENIRHAACAVKIEGTDSIDEFNDRKIGGYVYCETTGRNWRAGKKPNDIKIVGVHNVSTIPRGS